MIGRHCDLLYTSDASIHPECARSLLSTQGSRTRAFKRRATKVQRLVDSGNGLAVRFTETRAGFFLDLAWRTRKKPMAL